MSQQQPRRILITGASRGIGKATALAAAKAGLSTVLIGRSLDTLTPVADAVRQAGTDSWAFDLDLTDVAQIQPKLSKILDHVGSVDILVNNAGMGYTATLMDTPLQDWQRVLDLNLTSAFQCIQAVLPSMRALGQGTVINVISIAGKQAFPEWGAYCASKFGLMGLTKALAQEERAHGIRAIAICPGAVNTPLWDTDTVQADFDRQSMLKAEDVANVIVQAAMMPQQAVIEELVLMPNGGAF